MGRDPMALEETLFGLAMSKLSAEPAVYLDDLSLLSSLFKCGYSYPRREFFELPAKALRSYAGAHGRKLIYEEENTELAALAAHSYDFSIGRFQTEDYGFLCRRWLGDDRAATLDFAKIHRFAPKLDIHQLRAACRWLFPEAEVTTDRFIEYLRSQRLATNVDLAEVAAVDLTSLQGIEEVVRSLEVNVALPFENDGLAAELGLRPKRGVLLYGPPGTGKTTVGRALAHRLKGKFLMIDGTFVAGSNDFYQRVDHVFNLARDNSPAVIFIDDADAIFEDGEERGLYRYLLTKLDGLESESSARVCVMMTAMRLEHLPPALVRSGRVELWLEMKLPDAGARWRILEGALPQLPESLRLIDTSLVLAASEGCSGADVKRAVEDAKALYAYDRQQGFEGRTGTAYLLEAMAQIAANRRQYEAAERASERHHQRQPAS